MPFAQHFIDSAKAFSPRPRPILRYHAEAAQGLNQIKTKPPLA